MIRVIIRTETQNGREYGYGQYVNGYIEDDEFSPPQVPGIWASECVPFGHPTARAEKRVRSQALKSYEKEKRKHG